MKRAGMVGLALISGCTWVQLQEDGQGVRVVTAARAAGCQKVGVANVSTQDRLWIFARSGEKVQEELEFLARNEAAAELGGDTIVPRGPVEEGGRQSFDVYRCDP